MNSLLEKAIKREKIEDQDIASALYDICEDVHSSCSNECPVFERYGHVPWSRGRCPFHKNGLLMLGYLRFEGTLADFLLKNA